MKNSIKNKTVVYYNYNLSDDFNSLLVFPLESLKSELISLKETSPTIKEYLKCPSAQQYIKNTFILRSPISFEMELDSKNNQTLFNLFKSSPTFNSEFIHARSYIDHVYDLFIIHFLVKLL